MVFWMIFTLEKRIELLAKLFLFMFFISPACLCCCIVHWCKETHLIYGEGRHICLLVITFVLLGLLLWDFVAEFLTKILLKWYLEWLCFWASMFWSCDRKKPCEKPDLKHHKNEMISPSMKLFPLHLWQERSFLCNGEDTKLRFWVINYMLPNQKKRGFKRLVRGQNASILG